MKTLLLITFAVVFFLTGIDRTYALPVQWSSASGGNDHWYEVVNHGSGVSWDEAKALAESSTYLGLQGHLVTITSAAEDAFVLGFPVVGIQTWLGGFQDPEFLARGGQRDLLQSLRQIILKRLAI